MGEVRDNMDRRQAAQAVNARSNGWPRELNPPVGHMAQVIRNSAGMRAATAKVLARSPLE